MDFMANVLEESTGYSIISKALEGKILAWDEGARRNYGCEPSDVVGKASAFILYHPEDVKPGRAQELIASRLGLDSPEARQADLDMGCATGEEPHSLAILADRVLPDHSDWALVPGECWEGIASRKSLGIRVTRDA